MFVARPPRDSPRSLNMLFSLLCLCRLSDVAAKPVWPRGRVGRVAHQLPPIPISTSSAPHPVGLRCNFGKVGPPRNKLRFGCGAIWFTHHHTNDAALHDRLASDLSHRQPPSRHVYTVYARGGRPSQITTENVDEPAASGRAGKPNYCICLVFGQTVI